jgi:hypothetical protein
LQPTVGVAQVGLRLNHTIRELSLAYNEVGSEGVAAIGAAIGSNSTLTLLDLECCGVGGAGAAALAAGLATNSSLSDLQLSGNAIGRDGTIALARVLRINDTLQTLDLADNELTSHSLAPMLELLLHQHEEDDVGGAVAGGGGGMCREGNGVRSRSLSLWGNAIGAKGGVALVQLQQRQRQRGGSASGMQVRFQGSSKYQLLARAVAHDHTVTHLDLSACMFDDGDMRYLASRLGESTSLQSIDLSNNNGIGRAGLAALAALLQANAGLAAFVLRGSESMWAAADRAESGGGVRRGGGGGAVGTGKGSAGVRRELELAWHPRDTAALDLGLEAELIDDDKVAHYSVGVLLFPTALTVPLGTSRCLPVPGDTARCRLVRIVAPTSAFRCPLSVGTSLCLVPLGLAFVAYCQWSDRRILRQAHPSATAVAMACSPLRSGGLTLASHRSSQPLADVDALPLPSRLAWLWESACHFFSENGRLFTAAPLCFLYSASTWLGASR